MIANYLLNFPRFTKTFCFNGVALCLFFSEIRSCKMSNFLWFNKHILNEKRSTFFRYFFDKNLNFVYQLFDNNGSVHSWSNIEEKFDFNNVSNFKWQQLIYALHPFWKKNNLLLIIYYSQITILLKNTLTGIEKLNSRQLYSLFVYTHPYSPTSQKCFKELLKTDSFY